MGIRDLSCRATALVAALALLSIVNLGGCASALKLEAPQLSLISMKVRSADLFSQKIQVRVRVVNPNDRELPVKGITYRVEVNDSALAEGLSDTPFVVPARGEAEFDLQMNANLAGALSQILSRGDSRDTLDYRLVGSVSLSSGFLRRIPFDERGSVKLK